MFQCDINDAPVIGILGIVSHRAKVAAKDMYSVFDLNRSQASILLTLHHCESMSQKDLAKQLNITAPSITSSIRKMEQFGYIARQTDPAGSESYAVGAYRERTFVHSIYKRRDG